MARRLIRAGIAVLCAAAFGPAAPARADTGDIIAPQHSPPTAEDGWQAGTCLTDVPPCSPDTPNQFFTQAAGHPPVGFTQFIVKHTTEALKEEPVGNLKDVRVDLPPGLSVNPQATPQCELATFESNPLLCNPASVVGVSEITVTAAGVPLPPAPAQVYNLVPAQGEPALFGFDAAGSKVYLKSDVDWSGDYHEGFTIAAPPPPLGTKLLKNRLVFNGISGNGTFLTNPSTCHDPSQPAFAHLYSTFLRADSVEIPDPSFPNGSSRFEGALPPGVMPTGCGLVPFEPSIAVAPGTGTTDSPSGAAVDAKVPFNPLEPIANSNVRNAVNRLPDGMGLNPSAADGLVFCTDAQFGKGTMAPVSCPSASRIGTVSIETPPLPAGSLTGDVFLGQQRSRDPSSGEEYRIFVDAEAARFGVSARLVGNVSADPRTGQLSTTFAENPQVPFTSFKLQFNGGGRAPLTSPPACGPNESLLAADPYSETGRVTVSDSFTLTRAPGGGGCAGTLGARPFKPGFSTNSKTNRAGAFSPFSVHIARPNGQQELKGVDVNLPPGISGKLAGVPYCPPKDLLAAAGRAGAAEERNPSCPRKSRIGAASIRAGSGTPIAIKGDAYLSGPYRGAPLSLAVITPATAGPFDLGVVVVRVALFVDPDTARIRPVSDPIPHVFGGAKLSIRSIDVNANRRDFIVNPTSCAKLETAGLLRGGGSNPANPAAFSSFAVSAPFQTSKCRALRFRPRLFTRVFGGRKKAFRAQNPKFRATLVAREGDANIGRATVVLPRAVILDQSHIRTICTRPQLAANRCPKGSVYGHAMAKSPLLGEQLRGPVYLVPSNHILPDLLVVLRGQVEIHLRGAVKTVHGRLRNVFDRVPDVPVSKFVLTMRGGKRGLLTTTRDLCKGKSFSRATFRAQNGRRARKKKVKLRVPACKRGKKKRRG
jgi:hypothetical protein